MRTGLSWLVLMAFVGCDDGGNDSDQLPETDGGPPPDAETSEDMAPPPPPMDAAPPDGPEVLPPGELVLSAEEIDFGVVGVGAAGEGQLVLRNEGEGPLTVTDWAFEGPFSTSRQPPLTIPPGAQRTLLLRFTPDGAGDFEGRLSFEVDSPGAPPSVGLRGTGGAAEGQLESDRIDFGVVPPGMPAADFVLVTNTSETVQLQVSAVDGVMAPFELPVGQVPVNVEPGQTAMVLIQFVPEMDGDFESVVTVRSNAGDWEVTLAGRAVSAGDLVVNGVEPAWAPNDEAVSLVVHGGPFAAMPDSVEVGGVALEDLERLDDERLRGTLPAGGEPGPLDIRVEIGADFGLSPSALTRTGPVAEGRALDDAAMQAGAIGPDGNPWRLALDVVPAETELQIEPGTVVLGDERTLTVEGVLRTGGPGGQVVLSSAARTPGSWGGLRLVGEGAPSALTQTMVEYAGIEDGAAITTQQSASLVDIVVRQSSGDGIAVESGGTLVVLGGELADLAGDAMVLRDADTSVFRLQRTRVRRARWPVTGWIQQFPNPLGAGHDWTGNTHRGIGLAGTIEDDTTLGNQPAGIVYQLREAITVAEGATLTLAGAAPLVLDGVLTIAGELFLPTGLRVETAAGGRLVVQGGADLTVRGTPAEPVVFEARAPGGDPQPGAWDGVHIEAAARLQVTRLTVRDAGGQGPACQIDSPFEAIVGLAVEDSADVGLALTAGGTLNSVELRGNAQGTLVSGGNGVLEGITEDAAPAVRFDPQVLCNAWNTEELLDGEGQAASTDCD